MFLKLGPASLSLSSVKFGKGGYAVFRNEHFHFGVAVQELPFWFCTLFRFRGHCHFLVKQTLGIHFRRNPLSRNSWRKRDPVSKEKDDTYPISRNGSEARRSRFFPVSKEKDAKFADFAKFQKFQVAWSERSLIPRGVVGCWYQQTSNGSFSAVSKPKFASKH